MNNFSPVLAGIAALLFCGTAHANRMTQAVLVGGGTPSIATDLNNVAFAGMVSQFDADAIAAANPGLIVTLNDVQLTLNTVFQTGGTLQNADSQAQSFSFDLGLSTFVSASGSGSATAAQQLAIDDFGYLTAGNLAGDFGTQAYTNVAAGSSVSYPDPNNPSGTAWRMLAATAILTDAASLAAFTGTGSFGLGLDTISSTTTSGKNVVTSLNTMAGGAFGVLYDYTLTAAPVNATIPEPTSIVLLGAGFLGMGIARRRAV